MMEWKITRGSKGCIVCSKEFCEDEEYYSALFDENNTFVRKDYCAPCWCKDKGDGLFSFWKTRVPKKDKPVQKFVNNEVFLDMFARLEGKSEPNQRNLQFVLALYLIRKKIFKLKSFKRENGEEFFTLHYPKEDKEFSVYNPNLKEEEIEVITSEMSQLLNYPYLEQEVLINTD
ncbi:MAG: hypothetical protein HYV59_13870 [Planctomycetes bacterium]|nr:hypothetical protein [Planctomycetota bacterium]